jgi:hypothetical protein
MKYGKFEIDPEVMVMIVGIFAIVTIVVAAILKGK